MKTATFALMLAMVPSAWATSIAYSFSNATGTLGTSETYTSSGVSITAYGYEDGHAADLYGNSNGLGLVANGDQIGSGFIQMDMKNFWALDPTGVDITVGDVQPGEAWEIFGSNTLGSMGVEIQSGSSNTPIGTALAGDADNYRYLSVTASMGSDVVLSGMSGNTSTTPEPGSFTMLGLGVGLLGIGTLKRKF